MVRLCSILCAFAISGCGQNPGTDAASMMPDSHVRSYDARVIGSDVDAYTIDEFAVVDAGMDAPVFPVDTATVDGSMGNGPFDASTDTSHDVGSDDAPDAAPDAAISVVPCMDDLGLCVRMTDAIVPEVTGFWSNVSWLESSGTVVDSGWTPATCEGGLRRISPTTVDCYFGMSDLPSGHVIYIYPVISARPACTFVTCTGYWESYSFWFDGVSVTAEPDMGPVSLDRRTTPHGFITVIRYIIP
jgi:hypothetical protein